MTELLKVIFGGKNSEGKINIRNRFLGRGFNAKYRNTIGADFVLLEKEINEKPVKFQIFDINGAQKYNNVRSVYYRGALGGILCYDHTDRNSFEELNKWIKELWNHNGIGIIPTLIYGLNKDKLDEHPDGISVDIAERYAQKLSEKTKPLGFSVKNISQIGIGENIHNAFEILGQEYFKYKSKNEKPAYQKRPEPRKSIIQGAVQTLLNNRNDENKFEDKKHPEITLELLLISNGINTNDPLIVIDELMKLYSDDFSKKL
ncbi:MAG: GTP-binding protein [Nanoarchaeota archaeon]|nr:GTP-binding protein [Nanoarchaeota archaeon]